MDEIFVFAKGKGSLTAFPLALYGSCFAHRSFFAELPKPSVGDDDSASRLRERAKHKTRSKFAENQGRFAVSLSVIT